jgi:hypothetical protein
MVALGAHALLPNKSNPSLQEILANQSTRKPLNAPLIIASLLSVSIAALSAAKSYEIFKRSKSPIPNIAEAMIENESEAAIESEQASESVDLKKECESYKVMHEEAARSIQLLQDENKDFASRIKILYSEIDDMKKIESMLRKSNIALGKECEKLRSENEELLLKTNTIKLKKPKMKNEKNIKPKLKMKRKKQS